MFSDIPTVILTHEQTRPTLDRISHVIWIQWFGVYDDVSTLLGNEVYCYRAVATQLFSTAIFFLIQQ